MPRLSSSMPQTSAPYRLQRSPVKSSPQTPRWSSTKTTPPTRYEPRLLVAPLATFWYHQMAQQSLLQRLTCSQSRLRPTPVTMPLVTQLLSTPSTLRSPRSHHLTLSWVPNSKQRQELEKGPLQG